MTNYGDFDPTSSISIEGTHQDFNHYPQQHQQNWILLNKHESLREQSDSKRIVYHKPIIVTSPSTSQAGFVHRPTRNALQRMVSVNRLNDRIRRKLETNNNEIYASTSIFDDYHRQMPQSQAIKEEDDVTNVPSETSNRRAEKVVDDSFRFITDENLTLQMRTPFEGNNSNDERILLSPIKKPSGFQGYQEHLQRDAFSPRREDPRQEYQSQHYPQHQQGPLPRNRQSQYYPQPPSSSSQQPYSMQKSTEKQQLLRERGEGKKLHHRSHHRSLTDPLLTTRTRGNEGKEEEIYSSSQNSIVFDTQQPSTSRGGFLNGKSTNLIHNIPIKMIRKRADSLDSGSLRLNGKYEKDPHPTPLTASDWQTPAVSQRPSFSHRKRDSFQVIDRRPHRHRGNPSFNERYEPSLRRISQHIPSQRQPYRRPSRLPKKTPSLLRRDSYYYRKCDICLSEPRPDGLPCYACNSVNTYRPRNQRVSRRLSRNEYLQSRNVPVRKPSRMPTSSTRLPSQPPPPPPVTIEPYFEEVEEMSNETSSEGSNPVVKSTAYPPKSSNTWQAATIPPRTPSQTGFFDNQRFPYNTSPRRQPSNKILNAEGLQKHPSYMAYRRTSNIPLPSTYIPIRAQPSPNQQSRQSTVIWPANAGPAWKSIDHHRSRVNPSPVFRYGKQVPKWLYDYDAYAEAQKHKEIKQRRRKVFAIIVVFLLFALVVAAGVVLAAVN